MTKTTTTKSKKSHATTTIRDVLQEIKEEVLRMESSSSHGDVRQACRDMVALIEKYLG